ncbi:MAG: hypothetical protein WAZ21_04995 [Candidatus Saccharimonadales bacterium]
MNKDVIYIDVEDDITAIIGKVKNAQQKIVALVPPKRVGVLQSAVNLRLIGRTADTNNKRLVLITSNQALIALAAAAKIPVARNLQSKPELAEITALDIDDGEDVIDGSSLPVGDLARTADNQPSSKDAALDKAVGDINKQEAFTKRAVPSAAVLAARPNVKKSNQKVPNFNSFRKKFFLIIAGGVLLLAFLIWAIWFAPRATVVITAQTTATTVSEKVTLDPAAETNFAASRVHALVQQQKKQLSVDFDATGTKDVGEKATGTMKITRSGVSDSSSTIPAGTGFSSGGYTFMTTEAVTIPPSAIQGTSLVAGSATAGVRAADIGEEYNLSARAYQSSIAGYSGQGSNMTGGTKRQVKVVTASDIQAAATKLAEQKDDTVKDQLRQAFSQDVTVIDQSYTASQAAPTSVPAVDQEATGKSKLTSEVTYTLLGITKADLNTYLDAGLKKQLDSKGDQRVYENGSDKVTFAQFNVSDAGSTVLLSGTGKIGPNIEDAAVKEQSKGKRYGDVQSQIESIQGVRDVDVKFWPFWVTVVPNDVNKVNVEFKLNES